MVREKQNKLKAAIITNMNGLKNVEVKLKNC